MQDFKTILGLDIGVASIGWSLIRSTDDVEAEIETVAQGVRIIRYKEEGYKGEAATFAKGGNITINKDRTTLRTVRKGLERYKQRKRALLTALKKFGLLPENTDTLPEYTPLERWQKRADAATDSVEIPLYDLGRVLLHLNTKRGFQGSRKEAAADAKESSKYKATIKARVEKLQGRTIGQFLYAEMCAQQQQNKEGELHENSHFDSKNQVYNRADYKAEFEQICVMQAKFHAALTTEVIDRLKDIIYYQRPLKSQKHLISYCRYESREIEVLDKNGKPRKVQTGAKTAPLTSPLTNVFRVWQTMLNIKINDGKKQIFPIEHGSNDLFNQNQTPEQIKAQNDAAYLSLFMAFCDKESLTAAQITEALGFKGKNINLQKGKSVKGFETHFKIKTALHNAGITDKNTLNHCLLFDPLGVLEEQPLYRFWHILYSIETPDAAAKALYKQFGIKTAEAHKILDEVTFKNDYASMSSKAMQRILEKMSKAHLIYSDAVAAVGADDIAAGKTQSVYATEGHSNSMTKETDDNRVLLAALETIKRNELRNPVVEKILNQVILLVNEIIKTQGKKPDIIRIELARDLHKSAKERASMTEMNGKIEKEKANIRNEIMKDGGAYFTNKDQITDRDILKYRLWNEFDKRSPYEPNDIISLAELFAPNAYEIEHIVPRSLYYDDSFANKTIARRFVNKAKDNALGFPFMQIFVDEKGNNYFKEYKAFVEEKFKAGRIGKRKYDRLMATEVPTEFANRELNFTRYIATETLKRMKTVWRNNDVQVTVGSITAQLRKNWGLDTVIHDDRKPDFEAKAKHLVEYITTKNGNTYENIKGWDKRKDHRHHALDAFVVALTTRSIVKYFNDLNSEASKIIRRRSDNSARRTQFYESPNPMLRDIAAKAMENIVISYKSGGRVASTSAHRRPDLMGNKNKGKTINPRGALHEDTIYGKKLLPKAEATPLTLLKTELKTVADFDRILSPEHKTALLLIFTENCKSDFKTFYKYFDKNEVHCGKKMVKAVYFGEEKYVKRVKVDKDFDPKHVEKILDERIKSALKNRLEQYGNDPKKAFIDLDKNPIYADEKCRIPIKKVRILAFMTKGIKIPRGYVKSSSNHHLAIYQHLETQKLEQKITTFWEAFENEKQTGSPYVGYDADLGTMLLSYKINESVVFGFTKDEIQAAIDKNDYRKLRKHIYRVQKLAINDFWFRMQYETEIDDSSESKEMQRFILISSLPKLTCIKIDVDILGRITKIYDPLPIVEKKSKKV